MPPASPITTFVFQMQPALIAEPSFTPRDTKTSQSRAVSAILATSGPGTRTELAASSRNRS